MEIKRPYLIQRCTLKKDNNQWRLMYDYMGSTEFEIGEQTKSLKRMFVRKLVRTSAILNVNGQEIRTWMISSETFPFDKYEDVIKKLALREITTKELTYIPEVVLEQNPLYHCDVWFDFENDVLFTFGKIKAKKTLGVLQTIRQAWRVK